MGLSASMAVVPVVYLLASGGSPRHGFELAAGAPATTTPRTTWLAPDRIFTEASSTPEQAAAATTTTPAPATVKAASAAAAPTTTTTVVPPRSEVATTTSVPTVSTTST